MPYQTVTDLPEAIQGKYNAHQQRAFLAAFNSALGSGNDESSAFAVAHSAAQGAKALSGFKRLPNNQFMAWYTNPYQDRDREWFAESAIDDDLAYMAKEGEYPELWFWHMPVPELALGKSDVVFKAGRFAVAVGHIYDNPIAQSLADYAEANDYLLSHGFTFEEDAFRDNTYHEFHTFEISVLPSEKAANPYTQFSQFVSIKSGGKMNLKDATPDQLRELEKALADKGVDLGKLLDAGQSRSQELDKSARFKTAGQKDEVIEEAIEALDTPKPAEGGAGGLDARLKAVEDSMAELKGYMQSMAGDMKTLMPSKPAAEEKPLTEEQKAIKALQDELKAVKAAAETKAHSVADSVYESVLADMFDLREGGQKGRNPHDFEPGEFFARTFATPTIGGTNQ